MVNLDVDSMLNVCWFYDELMLIVWWMYVDCMMILCRSYDDCMFGPTRKCMRYPIAYGHLWAGYQYHNSQLLCVANQDFRTPQRNSSFLHMGVAYKRRRQPPRYGASWPLSFRSSTCGHAARQCRVASSFVFVSERETEQRKPVLGLYLLPMDKSI